ncbi:MAG: hypothetical protein RLN88_00035 [Ekhidna sp.]|uniref:hypothetical protein n=1 Tax=Ekhidna sp. TaxID=2608089 RepID=UPI0032EF7989
MKYLTIIFSFFICQATAQLPERELVFPSKDNLDVGSEYKNYKWLLDEQGFPKEFIPYFDYKDFEDFEPMGYLVADPPFHEEPDPNKIPKDKLHTYYQRGIDSTTVDYLSELLYKAKEPILSNFYLGYENYRFTWTRSFHNDYILTLVSKEENAEIQITEIDKNSGQLKKSSKKIKQHEFEEFKMMLINANFWIMKSYKWTLGNDGSRWTIEAHVPLAYKVLSRWSPNLYYEDDLILRQLGTWLINKSGIKVKEIY